MNTHSSVVVGVDGSGPAFDAVRWAAAEAALRGVPLLLAAVYALPLEPLGRVVAPPSYFEDQALAGRHLLDEAAELATDAAKEFGGVAIRTVLSGGRPVPVLLELSLTAGLVVLGSRGLGEFAGGLVGSVSSAVATHAHCPVVVIRGLPGPDAPPLDGPVVVGTDGSEHSEPAIAEAVQFASRRGADLTAVHAWTDLNLATVFDIGADDSILEWPAVAAGEEAVLAERLAGWKERYPDVSMRRVVVRDRPVRELARLAEGAQLLVVGSRGRGGFKGMLLGSTSRALLHLVDGPLMIVRGGA